jgi:protein-disulfide isomerase
MLDWAKSMFLIALSTVVACSIMLTDTYAAAQTRMGESPGISPNNFVDTSLLKPPPGVPIAVLEWEDLECPGCARAFPIVHAAVAKTHVALVERDYLISSHLWSGAAAVYARYLHDKISPEVASEYRRDLFAAQMRIAFREDLQRFTEDFFHRLGKPMPSIPDPDGQFQREIDADMELGRRIGISHTPTIVVVTASHWIEVLDPTQIDAAIIQAQQAAGVK